MIQKESFKAGKTRTAKFMLGQSQNLIGGSSIEHDDEMVNFGEPEEPGMVPMDELQTTR